MTISTDREDLTSRIPVYLYETVFPDYRISLFAALKATYGSQITMACGEEGFSTTLRTDPRAHAISVKLRNRYFLSRRLLWQHGLLSSAVNADLVIAEFSLRAVSTWLLLWLRSRKRKPTILWGHASGSSRYSKLIRCWMFSHCSAFIAYMPYERERLRLDFPKLPISVAPNSFMWASECYSLPKPISEINDVIYVGRLVQHKKVGLLLDGFCHAARMDRLPRESKLLLVGDGPEREALAGRAREMGLGARVVFFGQVSGVDALRNLYATALCAVSPGCVGLAATQSFCFGVPILIAKNEPHGPELEICRPSFNAAFFESDSSEALSEALARLFQEKEAWAARRSTISEDIRGSYTFDRMVETFTQVISTGGVSMEMPKQTTI